MAISLNVGSSSAISSYSELQDEIAAWLDRDDLTSRIPGFIQMAEAYFNRELRTLDMERSITLAVSSEDTALPDDYLAIRAIYVDGSRDRPLKPTSPDALRGDHGGQAGDPLSYAIVGDGIRIGPVTGTATSVTMDYFASIEGLSVTSPSNWLLINHADLYLFASLYFAELFNENPARAGQFLSLAEGIMARVKRASTAAKWGPGLAPRSAAYGSRC